MLAGKTAAKEDSLMAINDATELYDAYYGKQIDAIVCTEIGIISAGIMAFLGGIHLEKLDSLEASVFRCETDRGSVYNRFENAPWNGTC